jgi:hypothetical protein
VSLRGLVELSKTLQCFGPLVPDQFEADTLLRVGLATAFAFPDGTRTAGGLRWEAARGRLLIEQHSRPAREHRGVLL